jgi:hypothetical protein
MTTYKPIVSLQWKTDLAESQVVLLFRSSVYGGECRVQRLGVACVQATTPSPTTVMVARLRLKSPGYAKHVLRLKRKLDALGQCPVRAHTEDRQVSLVSFSTRNLDATVLESNSCIWKELRSLSGLMATSFTGLRSFFLLQLLTQVFRLSSL